MLSESGQSAGNGYSPLLSRSIDSLSVNPVKSARRRRANIGALPACANGPWRFAARFLFPLYLRVECAMIIEKVQGFARPRFVSTFPLGRSFCISSARARTLLSFARDFLSVFTLNASALCLYCFFLRRFSLPVSRGKWLTDRDDLNCLLFCCFFSQKSV